MNPRFSEYATSGAFTLSLTRNQVSTLSLLDEGLPGYLGHQAAALERKGLAEPVPRPTGSDPEAVEYRATLAGLYTARLCREAGLTNGPPDPLAAELEHLREEVARTRRITAEAVLVARSALARFEALDFDCENDRRQAAGEKLTIRLLRRDPLEGVSHDDLCRRLGSAGWFDPW